MTSISKVSHALLATALIAAPASALAQNAVADQAEEVLEKAEDLEAATNSLNAKVDAEQRADAALAAEGNLVDGDDRRNHRDGDDDSGKWGWLGLLGLAGLLGLKRRDDHVDHDHRTDAERDRARAAAASTNANKPGGLDRDPTTRL